MNSRSLVRRRKNQFVPHSKLPGLDPAGNDATFVESINILHAKSQWKIEIRALRLQQIEGFKGRRTFMPFHLRARLHDVLAVLSRGRNEHPRFQSKLLQKFSIFLFDLVEFLLREIGE